jgi:hypothetical protein
VGGSSITTFVQIHNPSRSALRLLRGSTSLQPPMGLAPRMAPLVTITRTFGAFGPRFFDLRSRHLTSTTGAAEIGSWRTDQITPDANRQDGC